MTEQELQQQRTHNWRLDGAPVRTLEDAKSFLDTVGFCARYPVRSLPLLPTFFGACAGSSHGLPDAKHAFSDPRTKEVTDLVVRLLRERTAFEIHFLDDTDLIVSAALFPFFYALVSDRNPKAPPKLQAQGKEVSELALRAFDAVQNHGPLSKVQMQELLGRELSLPALDRALTELWSALKITRVDYSKESGASWDVLYRWAPEAVKEGVGISAPEAISALVSKYLETVVAAEREEIEALFSHLAARSKVREAINALLAARELSFITVGARTMVHMTPPAEPHQRRMHG